MHLDTNLTIIPMCVGLQYQSNGICFMFLILLISRWAVAASFMAEKPTACESGNLCRR